MSYDKKLKKPKVFRVYLEEDQIEYIKKYAEDNNSDLSKLCRKIISQWILGDKNG